MSRLPKIDKQSADPEILQHYQDLRNERRSQWLWISAPIIIVLCILAIMMMALLSPSLTVVAIVSIIGIASLLGWMLFIAGWSPHGTRLKITLIVLWCFVLCTIFTWSSQ